MTTIKLLSWTVIAVIATTSTATAQRGGTIRNQSNTNKSFFSTSVSSAPRRAGVANRDTEFRRWSQLMDSDVILKGGDTAGSITDFVIGPQGNIEYLVATNGEQMYSIPFGAAQMNAQNQLQLDLTSAQFQQMPFFSNNNWPNFATPQFRGQMVNTFGPEVFNHAGVSQTNDISTGRPYGNDAFPNPTDNLPGLPFGGPSNRNVNQQGNRNGNDNLPGLPIGGPTNRNTNSPNGPNNNGSAPGINAQNPAVGRRPGSITNTSPTAEQREQNRPGNLRNDATNPNRSTGGGVQTGPNNATGPGLIPGNQGPNSRRPIPPVPSGTGGNPLNNNNPSTRPGQNNPGSSPAAPNNTPGTSPAAPNNTPGAGAGETGVNPGTGTGTGGMPTGTGSTGTGGGAGTGTSPASGSGGTPR